MKKWVGTGDEAATVAGLVEVEVKAAAATTIMLSLLSCLKMVYDDDHNVVKTFQQEVLC